VAGDTQTLVFHEGDDGPYYENEEQWAQSKNSCADTGAGTEKPKPWAMMLKAIREKNIELPKWWFSAVELWAFGQQHGLALTYLKKDDKKGWLNQPKGDAPSIVGTRTSWSNQEIHNGQTQRQWWDKGLEPSYLSSASCQCVLISKMNSLLCSI
jgi:hypothetical protein